MHTNRPKQTHSILMINLNSLFPWPRPCSFSTHIFAYKHGRLSHAFCIPVAFMHSTESQCTHTREHRRHTHRHTHCHALAQTATKRIPLCIVSSFVGHRKCAQAPINISRVRWRERFRLQHTDTRKQNATSTQECVLACFVSLFLRTIHRSIDYVVRACVHRLVVFVCGRNLPNRSVTNYVLAPLIVMFACTHNPRGHVHSFHSLNSIVKER